MSRAFVSAVLACIAVACHRAIPVQEPVVSRPPVVTQAPVVSNPVVPKPADSSLLSFEQAPGGGLNLKVPAQRDSLLAVLRRERALWRASAPRDYQFQLKVACFCPGVKGWLTMEVRSGQPLRAWDQAGKAVPITDWNTRSVDGLFDHLEGFADVKGSVQVGFDPRWHFPSYISTARLPGPDMWSVIEARGLRPAP